ncbi:PHD finger protein 12 isoform X2 [Uranotaenia lowii]|uniref:PHD finger protein 12 isoform X2 n=1 Tax=Uranotaenia lowii TaxID=190385 RepID=UPI002478EF7B|nr:PHD finger protein 12 isoform X2 [Uranotaenia lowii]
MSKYPIQLPPENTVGLMPLINALVKPPDHSEMPKATTKKLNSYYRKPGRGHNNDICYYCSEGGDLICCDRCPSSFHLGCHDPPLDEEEIPNGIWICNTCKRKDNSNMKSSPYDMTSSGEIKLKNQKTSTSLRRKLSTITTIKDEEMERFAHLPETRNVQTPLDHLIRAARMLNPRQFELPKDISMNFPFPGTDKQDASPKNSNGNKRGPKNRKLHELDVHGMVPLPAKTCHTCGKSCRKAPLISCDYCDLFFHQDCVDPPLTALPTAMWMCPNHVEQFVDWKLINSVSATERIRLWNKFKSSIDQETVKNEFLRKIHRRNPPFRIKQKAKIRGRLTIPPNIKYHYENRIMLMPSLRDFLRNENIGRSCKLPKWSYNDLNVLSIIDVDLELIRNASIKVSPNKSNSDHEITENCSDSEVKEETNMIISGNLRKDKEKLTATDQLKSLDKSVIHKLALERLQQLISSQDDKRRDKKTTVEVLSAYLEKNENDPSINLPSQLITKDDIERIARDFTSPKREIVLSEERSSCTIKENDNNAKGNTQDVAVTKNMFDSISHVDIRIRAVLTPVYFDETVDYSRSMFMRYRKLRIGRGQGCDIMLQKFGKCQYVSEKHAVIFYDEISQSALPTETRTKHKALTRARTRRPVTKRGPPRTIRRAAARCIVSRCVLFFEPKERPHPPLD